MASMSGFGRGAPLNPPTQSLGDMKLNEAPKTNGFCGADGDKAKSGGFGSNSGGGTAFGSGVSGGFGSAGGSSGFGSGSGSGFSNATPAATSGFASAPKTNGDTANHPPAGEGGDPPPERPPVTYVPPELDMESLFNDHQNVGINFERYGKMKVEMTELSVEDKEEMLTVNSFDDLNLPPELMKNIGKMGYVNPTPIQKVAIPIITKREKDVMACAQTGSGKTAAFMLPILADILKERASKEPQWCNMGSPFCIIVAPTRELAVQIANEGRKFAHGTGAGVVEVYGGVQVRHQALMVRRGSDVVVGTSGRLLDFIGKGIIKLENVKYLVLDEADRMLDMGFAPEFEKLVQSEGFPAKEARTTLMFSATFPVDIQQLARNNMKKHTFLSIGVVGGACEDVVQEIEEVADKFKKKDRCMQLLKKDMTDAKDEKTGVWLRKTLVFVESKNDADYLGGFMSQEGIPSTTAHGDRDQMQRELAMNQFRSGHFPILIATNVASRGLDIKGVDHVIQMDLPREIEDYVHRIGRTGRVGNPGRATGLFLAEKDSPLVPKLVKVMSDASQLVPPWLEKLASGPGPASYNPGDSGGFGESSPGFGTSSGGFEDAASASAPKVNNALAPDDDWD